MEPKTHGEFLIGKSSQDNNSSLDELDPTNNIWKDIMYLKEYIESTGTLIRHAEVEMDYTILIQRHGFVHKGKSKKIG